MQKLDLHARPRNRSGRGKGKHKGWEARPPQVDTSEHLRLVYAIAGKFTDRGIMDFDERVSLGVQGLEKAARIFEPARGLRFSTMAVMWIFQAINRAYEMEGFSPRPVAKARKAKRIHLSALGRVREDDAPHELVDPHESPVEADDFSATIWRHVDGLDERAAAIVRGHAHGRSDASLAQDLGVSRARVHQIRAAAFETLRQGPLSRVA